MLELSKELFLLCLFTPSNLSLTVICPDKFRTLNFYILGTPLHLRHYDTKRQRRNVPTMIALDWLGRLYKANFMPLILARGLGINALNHTPFMKVYMSSCVRRVVQFCRKSSCNSRRIENSK